MNQNPYQHVYSTYDEMNQSGIFSETPSNSSEKGTTWSFRNKPSSSTTKTESKQADASIPSDFQYNPNPKQSESKTITVAVKYHNNVRLVTVPRYCSLGQLKSQIQSTFHIKNYIVCYGKYELKDPLVLEEGAFIYVVDASQAPPNKETSQESKGYKLDLPTLTLPNYTISPSLDKLSTYLNSELEVVDHVVIECKGIGKIEWQEPVNLRGVNLDHVIRIEKTGEFPSISVIVLLSIL